MSHSKFSSKKDVTTTSIKPNGERKQNENLLSFIIMFVAIAALYLFIVN